MTTALKELLDDAAADAVRELRIDLDDVRERSRRRRRRIRTTGSLVMLAAAAAVAAAIAVPLALVAPVTPAVQGSQQVGLPDRWYFAPRFVPPVTRQPMPAASMLLAGDGNAPVLVSADSRSYARLPWGPDDAMAALSADGTQVAWATQGTWRSTIHLLRLSDGEQFDARLPAGSGLVYQLVWADGQVNAWLGLGQAVRVDGRTGRVSRLCSCEVRGLGADGSGRLVQSSVDGGPDAVPGVTFVRSPPPSDPSPAPEAPTWARDNASAANPAWSFVAAPILAADPSGRVAANTVWGIVERAGAGGPGWYVSVPGESRAGGETRLALRILDRNQVTDAEVLAWTDAGILVRVDTIRGGSRGASLKLIDPEGGATRTVSTRYEGADVPMAVASGLIGDGRSIDSEPPDFPFWDRDRIRYAVETVWRSHYPYAQLITLGALAAVAGLVVVRRRRRFSP